MVLGTASDVGKSVVAAGLCRLLVRRGRAVAPFKAQNMSLNACATLDGGEIGWAQAAQAEACGLAPRVDFNPVLLKPTSDRASQVIVGGRVYRQLSARDYYGQVEGIWRRVEQSYRRLASEFEVIVLEGAGSAAEINLRERDIVNFRMAEAAGARVLLVADIERGGVFAAVVGTLQLLTATERARVAGVIVNKFRGDPTLFVKGRRMLEQRAGVPVLGILPFVEDLEIPEEDSLALARRRDAPPFLTDTLNIAVLAFPHLANFVDFAELEREPGVRLRYLDHPGEAAAADVLILGGSKSTLHDLEWLRARGWERAIARCTGEVVGICGGYQMLGQRIADPAGVDGPPGQAAGLGLLDVAIRMHATKTVRRVRGRLSLPDLGAEVEGYEIHMGKEQRGGDRAPLWLDLDGSEVPDGAASSDGRIWGCHLHGLFKSTTFRRAWLHRAAGRRGIRLPESGARNDPFDAWSDLIEQYLDLERIGFG